MGGQVHPNPVPEIGWYRLHTRRCARTACYGTSARATPIFSGMRTRCHRPARQRGRTRSCRQQAYRLGDHAWGLQFHLEADTALIERWLRLPAARTEIERHWTGRRIAHIRAATRRHLPAAQLLSDKVFGEFVGLFAGSRRYALLASG
jgi:GMP synthase (glutamine-hydrolysing)